MWLQLRKAAEAERLTEPASDPGIMDLEVPRGEGLYRRLKQAVGLDDPDMRRNPLFRVRNAVYGPGKLRRALALAAEGRRVADLGCGCGWFALEVAHRNRNSKVLAVDRDAGVLEWAHNYYLERRMRRPLGEVAHVVLDVAELDLKPASQDVVVAFFLLGCLEDPHLLLSRLREALRPGGVLLYYDATTPPVGNVRRLAGWSHRRALWRGELSDSWRELRRVEAAYRQDAVRRWRPAGAPPEEEVFAHLERDFDLVEHRRSRAFVDLVAGSMPLRRAFFELPALKLLDEAAMLTGLLEGASRFVVARRP